jgi:type IV secretion system protein VirB10
VTEKAEMPSSKMDAPSGLDLNPRPPRSVRVSKRAAGTLMAIAAIILGLFAYGGYKRQQRQFATLAEGSMPRNVAPATAAGAEIAKDLPSGNVPINAQQRGADPGLLQPPGDVQAQAGQAPNGGQVFVRQAPVPVQPPVPQIPQPREPSPDERRLLAAYEREQQAIAAPTTLREGFGSPALGSGLQSSAALRGAGDDASQIASVVQALTRQNGASQVTPEAVRALIAQRSQSADRDGESEPNGQATKEAFLAKARAGQSDDYLKSTRTAPLSRYEIKAGWEIPAVLEQALNSDLPGELKALVSSNVYDTASGRYLMIPQGSRLVGVYNSRIGYGQDGVQVIWDRVIYPDGSSLDLSGMIGQDAHGFSGFRDKVDRHYNRLIGFAVLTSLFAAASEISQNQNRSLLTNPSPAQVAGSAVGQQASDLGAQITRRNLNVQPTIKVAIGYRFNVRVNRDMLFDAPYTPVPSDR